jgi:hypothetical protein
MGSGDLSPPPLAASFSRGGRILRGYKGIAFIPAACALAAFSLTSNSLLAVSSTLQPRRAAILQKKKSARLHLAHCRRQNGVHLMSGAHNPAIAVRDDVIGEHGGRGNQPQMKIVRARAR